MVAGIFPAVKLPPWWAVPVIWRFTAIFWYYRLLPKCYRRKTKTAYRQNMTAVLYYRRKIPPCFGFTASAKKVPPTLDTAKKYRQLSIPSKEYQLSIPLERYRQHWIPPKRYR